jgi:hypothetical protein
LRWGLRITEGEYLRITKGEYRHFACRIEQGDGSGSARFSWASTVLDAESSAPNGSRFRGGAQVENTRMRARKLLPDVDVEDSDLGLC